MFRLPVRLAIPDMAERPSRRDQAISEASTTQRRGPRRLNPEQSPFAAHPVPDGLLARVVLLVLGHQDAQE